LLANVGAILTGNIRPILDEYLPMLDQCQTNIMNYWVNIRGISDNIAITSDQYRTILTKEWPLYVRESYTTTIATCCCYKYKYKFGLVERGLQIVQGR